MKLIARLLAGLAVIIALFVASEREAHALGPIDLEAGLKVGFATNPNSDANFNPFGFGLGARAGIQIFSLYLGGNAMHYFGGSTTAAGLDVSESMNELGGEVGYTIGFIPLLQIRPQIGFGDAILSAEVANVSQSKGYFYLEPGLTVLVPLGLLYVGADANALLLPSVDSGTDATGKTTTKTYTSFTLHAQVGIRL
jgi:hypothetical protein